MREGFFLKYNPAEFKAKQFEQKAANQDEEIISEVTFIEEDIVDVLVGEREELAESDKAKEKYRQFRVNQALQADEITGNEEKSSLVEYQNKKERLNEKNNKEETLDKENISGEAFIERHGVIWGKEYNRYGELAHGDGKAVEAASVSLNLVKSEGGLNPEEMVAPKIDSEGANDPSDLDPESSEEALDRGGRELVERYLENVFRKFGGEVYKVGDVNEYAMGHSVDFAGADSDLVYGLPYSRAEEMHQLMEEGAALLSANEKAKFSQQTGLNVDTLHKNDLGFVRKIKVGGKTYTVKFVYLKEKSTGQDSMENDILEAA